MFNSSFSYTYSADDPFDGTGNVWHRAGVHSSSLESRFSENQIAPLITVIIQLNILDLPCIRTVDGQFVKQETRLAHQWTYSIVGGI